MHFPTKVLHVSRISIKHWRWKVVVEGCWGSLGMVWGGIEIWLAQGRASVCLTLVCVCVCEGERGDAWWWWWCVVVLYHCAVSSCHFIVLCHHAISLCCIITPYHCAVWLSMTRPFMEMRHDDVLMMHVFKGRIHSRERMLSKRYDTV